MFNMWHSCLLVSWKKIWRTRGNIERWIWRTCNYIQSYFHHSFVCERQSNWSAHSFPVISSLETHTTELQQCKKNINEISLGFRNDVRGRQERERISQEAPYMKLYRLNGDKKPPSIRSINPYFNFFSLKLSAHVYCLYMCVCVCKCVRNLTMEFDSLEFRWLCNMLNHQLHFFSDPWSLK